MNNEITAAGHFEVMPNSNDSVDQHSQSELEIMHAMLNNMLDGFALAEIIEHPQDRPAFRFLEMNDAFRRHYGFAHSLLGLDSGAWPAKPPAWLSQCAKQAASGKPFQSVHQDGAAGRHYEIQAYGIGKRRIAILSRDISAAKHKEQALREQEQHLWQMLAGLPGMMAWAATADGQVDFASPQWTAYTGKNHLGQRGRDWMQILHPDDREGASSAWQTAVAACSAWSLECRLRRHDGQYHWFAWRGTPLRNDAGKLTRWFGVCIDIDDLKRTQERLQESERRYSALFGKHTIGIAHYRVLTDSHGQPVDYIVERVNQAYERIIGIQRTAIEGKRITEVFPDIRKSRFDFIDNFGQVGLEDGEGSFEVYLAHNARWVSVYAYSPQRGECTAMFTDITEQKQAAVALHNSEETLRATFELAEVGITHVSADGHIIRANRKFADMLGFSASEICGKHILDLTHPEDQAYSAAEFKRMNAGELPSISFEKRYLRKDQTPIWARITGSPIRDPDTGLIKFNVAIIEDITQRKEAEIEHARLMEQLQEAATRADQNHAQLEAVFQTIAEGIAVFDMEGRLVMLNPALARTNGFPTVDDMKRPFDYFAGNYELRQPDGELVPVDQWPVSRVLRGETISNWELQGCRLDTNQSWYFSFSGSPVRNDKGEPVLAVVNAHDITERRRLEQQRRESERRLQLAVAIAHVGFWEWEVDTGHCYFSPTWKKQIGYQDDELSGRFEEWESRLHPEDRKKLLEKIDNQLEQRAADYRMEYRLRHRDGSYRWMIANAVPLSQHENNSLKLTGTQLDITEAKLTEERIRQAAQHDPLTGLPNRALIFEYAGHLLAAARRNHGHGAFLFVDLDRFKPINDLYGHEIGDKLLQEVARRLRTCVRDEDLVGRLGGDEFVVVLPHISDAHPATTVAQHVIDALNAPFEIDTLDLSISASVGISQFPQHGLDVDALIHAADLAMYQAKQTSRGTSQIYSATLTRRADASASIEALLKRALAGGGLTLHYQPVIDMRSNRIIGAEALLRLVGENGQILGPDRFIPIAESAGLISAIGEWVASEACRQHELWRQQGLPPVTIAINVSPLQFRQRGFARRLAEIILASEIDPSCIQIEVTESTVMESMDDAIATLNSIRAAGIRIALDDFGTGYSSLSHLSHLPLDKLKVDQSFVKRLEHDKTSQAITGAIITLGRTLNLEVVGEGIESPDALAYLQQHGCDQAQGFLISRPLTASGFAHWYRSYPH